MARLTLLFALLLLPMTVLAHRVNVFAYAEGDTIHVEARFQKGVPSRDSEVWVSHAKTGREYLQGRTDADGRFSFAIPDPARANRADLKIELSAGEGHRSEWLLAAGDYLPPLPVSRAADKVVKTKPAAVAAIATPQTASPTPVCPPPPDLTAQVEAAAERKIAPLRQMLLDSQNPDPGLREIVAGIGYLVGLAGLLAYARSRGMPARKS